MKDKFYNEIISHYQEDFLDWTENKHRPFRKVDNYAIYFIRHGNGKIGYRFHSSIAYWYPDEGMTMKDVADEILKDVPFINSIVFYDETPMLYI